MGRFKPEVFCVGVYKSRFVEKFELDSDDGNEIIKLAFFYKRSLSQT
jgi:hypothetical protein